MEFYVSLLKKRKLNKTENSSSCILKIIGLIIGSVLFFYLFKYLFWWVPNLAYLLDLTKDLLQKSVLAKIVTITIFIVIAFCLIKLKERLIVAYGILEVVGAIWTIWSTFSQNFENTILYSLALGGGIFLFVDGSENILKQKDIDSKKSKSNKV